MPDDNFIRQEQPDSQSREMLVDSRLAEPIEQVVTLFDRYADAVIRHRNPDCAVFLLQRYGNSTTAWTEAHGVLNEIRDNLLDPL